MTAAYARLAPDLRALPVAFFCEAKARGWLAGTLQALTKHRDGWVRAAVSSAVAPTRPAARR